MISVAMTTYNGEKYICEQIESILNQSMKVDEIIVCDDGSSDSTIELLKKYQEEKQWTAIVQLAHKMLPMFRQLEIDEEIPLLEKLEQATKNDLPENQISSLTQEVIDKTILLLKEYFKIS